MALDRAALLFPLLAMVVVGLVSSESAAEKFQRQHVDSKSLAFNDNTYCNQMMKIRGMTKGNCKVFNTFILESIWKIRAICWNKKTACKQKFFNCHMSREPLKVTECQIKGNPKDSPCKYQTINDKKCVTVACNGWPPLPVHFDSSKDDICQRLPTT
ncbi:ribonuclease pancreatic-like [Monodelphis domestica]|uniref:ribonuclease pancreatic-like n=1 Tax=Monodelphis domestica TaxID=13616 RepID=UPI0024E2245A|nr:ribonuclease pancreatic-like [Monodelphis domestica]XP_056665950.1 ribonuclease pancreatic-like [Monodelphis domestica]